MTTLEEGDFSFPTPLICFDNSVGVIMARLVSVRGNAHMEKMIDIKIEQDNMTPLLLSPTVSNRKRQVPMCNF